ncbi:hypothetical protein CDL15_Pgr021903 [Punica granatum]|uniref:PGG domain-containing protein n=1 Tax=Punica granatum TaxID=22663 RepID=A0A218WTA8_PUNGR|nr:hypothetical protein CDL15_Pgr021903 [Punica granatum]PKI54576.1 hypothetical protein CRG98_025090 [Punica granatum]
MDPQLYEAASSGDLEFITRLKPDNLMYLGHLTPLNNTILHIAVTFRQKDFAAQVLKLYPSFLELVNEDGNTPLHIAAKIGCLEIAQLLIDSGRDSDQGHDKLACSCSNRNVLRTVNRMGDTALHVAVRNGHFDLVELLIREDVELSTFPNLAGETPVFLAVEGGFFNVARHILRASPAAPPSRGTHGMTALHAALIRTHHGRESEYYVPDLSLENIRRIIRDSLLNVLGRFGGFRTQQIDIIKELLEKWPEMVKEVDGQKWTPLHYAAHLGHLEATQYLLEVDRSIAYLQNMEGMSAFHLAAKAGHIKVMDELIDHCPDICELLDNKGRTALHLAVANGKAKAVKFTLERKKLEGLINFPDHNGNTPLHLAALYGNCNILMTLTYDQRVDKKVVNKEYLKAIDVIQSNTGIGELRKTRIMQKMEQAGGRQSLRRVIFEERDMQNPSWIAELEVEEIEEFSNSERDLSPNLYSSNSSSRLDDISSTRNKSNKDIRLRNQYNRLRNISGTHLLVAVLIATVTFTAGFTVPGGYKDQGTSQGTAVLTPKVAFKVFLIANALAFYCSTASAFLHFVVSLEENYHLLLRFTKSAAALIYISTLLLGIAFTSGMLVILPGCCSAFFKAILVLGCCFLGFCLFGFI